MEDKELFQVDKFIKLCQCFGCGDLRGGGYGLEILVWKAKKNL